MPRQASYQNAQCSRIQTLRKLPVRAPVRATGDVDAIAPPSSYVELVKLENTVRELGFRECIEEGARRCRWVSGDLKLDLMPTDAAILGFANR